MFIKRLKTDSWKSHMDIKLEILKDPADEMNRLECRSMYAVLSMVICLPILAVSLSIPISVIYEFQMRFILGISLILFASMCVFVSSAIKVMYFRSIKGVLHDLQVKEEIKKMHTNFISSIDKTLPKNIILKKFGEFIFNEIPYLGYHATSFYKKKITEDIFTYLMAKELFDSKNISSYESTRMSLFLTFYKNIIDDNQHDKTVAFSFSYQQDKFNDLQDYIKTENPVVYRYSNSYLFAAVINKDDANFIKLSNSHKNYCVLLNTDQIQKEVYLKNV